MVWVIPICIVIILITIYINKPTLFDLDSSIQIQGIRLRASLDEIYNRILPTEKIDIVAILDKEMKTIWSANIQLHLSSEYYNIDEYILILRRPVELSIDSFTLYTEEVTERVQFILQRRDVFIAFTDVNGVNIYKWLTYGVKSLYIIALGCVVIGLGLFISVKVSRSIFRQAK